jgi:spermidine synthase
MSFAHVVTAFPNLTKIAHMQQTGERLFPNVEEAKVYIKGYIHQLSYRLVRSSDPAKHAKHAAESRARHGKANRESEYTWLNTIAFARLLISIDLLNPCRLPS